MTVLVCPPTYFNVVYSINPWMNPSSVIKEDNLPARRQWQKLTQIISLLEEQILEVRGKQELPDMCFTANAGLVRDHKVILSNFKYSERRGEEQLFKNWFEKNNYQVLKLPEDIYYEGAGDSLSVDDILFCGYGFRSDPVAYNHQVFLELGFEKLVHCQLIDPRFYHLDTCFCPINKDLALIYAAAFSPESYQKIKNCFKNLINVTDVEAVKFACNAVVIDRNVILPKDCYFVNQQLREFDYYPWEIEIDEFLKAGGGPRCLCLKI